MPETIHDVIKYYRDKDSTYDWSEIAKYRDYAKGKQMVTLTEKQMKILKNLLTHDFSDNVCKQIIAEAADRLKILSVNSTDKQVNDYLQALYLLLKIPDRQGDVHYGALRDGNYVVAVNWNNLRNKIAIHREKWWDGTSGVWIKYDDEDEVEYGVKDWVEIDGKTFRRLIWFPDRIERYTGDGQSWEPYKLETDTAWPVPWTDMAGLPMGVAYTHFANANNIHENYGDSELAGGVLGFQDQLTDAQYAIS